MSQSASSNGGTIRTLAIIITVLLLLLGAALGHITTYGTVVGQLQDKYVPRTELDGRMAGLKGQLNRVERKLDRFLEEKRNE